MTTTTPWHLTEQELGDYERGTAGSWLRPSAEAHLLACASCRAALAQVRGRPSGNDQAWAAIAHRIDQPRRPLRWSTGAFKVSLASPPLVVVTILLAFALIGLVAVVGQADPSRSTAVLLALAPLAPLAGAAIAYRPSVDPAGSLALATPLAGGRLPLMRAIVAGGVALVAGALASAFTPLPWHDALVWLLPGIAMAAVALAAGTWVSPAPVASGLAGVWVVVVGWWSRQTRSLDTALDDLVVSRTAVQVGCLAVALAAIAVCVVRRDAVPGWRSA